MVLVIERIVDPSKMTVSRAEFESDFAKVEAFEEKIDSVDAAIGFSLFVNISSIVAGCIAASNGRMSWELALTIMSLCSVLSIVFFARRFTSGFRSARQVAEAVEVKYAHAIEFPHHRDFSPEVYRHFKKLFKATEGKEFGSREYHEFWGFYQNMLNPSFESFITSPVLASSIKERFNVVKDNYEDITLDPLNVLDYSTLFDTGVRETSLFLKQLYRMTDDVSLQSDVFEVGELERLWEDARQYAQHVGLSYFVDKSKAVRARKLLVLANDESATPAERVNASERAQAEVESLFTVSVAAKIVPVLRASHARLELSETV